MAEWLVGGSGDLTSAALGAATSRNGEWDFPAAGKPAETSGEDDLRTLEVVLAAIESAERGGVVRVGAGREAAAA